MWREVVGVVELRWVCLAFELGPQALCLSLASGFAV